MSCHEFTGAPSMATMRSPARSPALAAGCPATTVPSTGSLEGVETPAKKKMPKKRKIGRTRFMKEPARMTIMRAGIDFAQ